MCRVVLIGLGRVGSRALRIAQALEGFEGCEFVVLDADPGKRRVAEELGASFTRVEAPADAARLARGSDLVMVSLPSSVAPRFIEELSRVCVDVVDVSYSAVDPYVFEKPFLGCGSVYVPDAGFAPGYSNMLVGEALRLLGGAEKVEILVGGIPKRPVPPIGYVVTWSAEDLLEEYTRCARIVVDGKVRCVDPLEEVLRFEIEGFGMLEGFYSDGLRTLLRNVEALNMYEATLRWPGHLSAMKLLRDLGLLEDRPLEVGGARVSPRKLLARLLDEVLAISRIGIGDVAILEVRVEESGARYRARAVMEGEPNDPATPRFTAAVFAATGLAVLRRGAEPGVKPLELLTPYKPDVDRVLRRLGASTATEVVQR
ncbi:MAG: saccharopine dehydrogenase family protein [Thermoprotei archaeon]|nr:MAG: saccharopine dehydrogenase family protein [Thermoprotei archaeon]